MNEPSLLRLRACAATLLLLALGTVAHADAPAPPAATTSGVGGGSGPPWKFEVSVPRSLATGPMTGRLILVIAKEATPEPRAAIGLAGPVLAGVDIEQLPPGQVAVVDGGAVSYPLAHLAELPAGDYFVQAVLIRYQQVRRSDGHVLWVPTAHRRVPFTELPGNLYSKVQPVHLDPGQPTHLPLQLAEVVGPLEEPQDTPYLRHVTLQSKLLTRFWGTPVYLRATVLLPEGYDTHPRVYYPAIYPQSQGATPFMFDTRPATREEQLSAQAGNLQTGYDFYQTWISAGFPRVAAILIEQSSPYFLEAYSVDSANNGPYGQAITQEMIPYLEKQFRLIAKPYARLTEGASTGGWEALAMQLYYPDFFGGAWVFNPDPISFRHYQLVDIYKDENAFSLSVSPFLQIERPFRRTVEGQVTVSLRQLARLEDVFGSRGRSGYQLDAWQSVHGPVDAAGYPAPLFDKLTGKINRDVVNYMRDHGYDLTEYTRSHWPEIGAKLVGKLNFFSGEMDNFYLNLAVYDFQDMLQSTTHPHYTGRFEYGRPKKGHGWHLTDFSQMVREMAGHIAANAPAGEDSTQWHY
jgi:enterochelin esterase-like enzyme